MARVGRGVAGRGWAGRVAQGPVAAGLAVGGFLAGVWPPHGSWPGTQPACPARTCVFPGAPCAGGGRGPLVRGRLRCGQPRCFPFSLMRTSLMQSVRCVGPLSVRQGAGLPRAVAGTSSLLLLRPRRLWPGWGRLRPARAPPFAVALPAHLCELGKEPQLPLLPQTAVATGPARPAAPGLKTRRRARVRARALLGPSLPADTSKHSVVCVDTWHSKFHVGALLCTHWAF